MHIKKEILNQSHSRGVSLFYLSLLPSHCCLQMKSWLNCCESLYVIYVIHTAFLRDEKHIEHFLYLTIYSISIDYEISIGFRNLRSEKAQGASLLIHSKPPDRTQGLVTILLFSYYIWPPLHYKIHKVFYSKGVVA